MKIFRAFACVALLSVSVFAHAQHDWPSNTIRIVLPYPPGSSGDAIARRITPKLSQELGATIIVENRPGANGNIAMNLVAKARPDGYTLLMGSDIQFAVAPVLFSSLPYDVDRDYVTIGPVASIDLVLVAYKGLQANNLRELVTLAKSKPGQVSFASTGIGSTHQLFIELLKMRAGIDLMHVPFAGTGPATPNLISGEVQLMLFGVPQAIAQINSGMLKPLAVGAANRLPLLPNVPTIAESGYPGYEANNIWALWSPAKTPDAIVQKVRKALVKAVNEPEIKEWYAASGLQRMESEQALTERLKADRKKWAEVIKVNNIKPSE
jgi:tripartite-type tricarboxylate transporter receptor subunit TctC